MEEIEYVLEQILEELRKLNKKLDSIQGNGAFNTLSDICDKLSDLDFTISLK